MTDAVAGDAEPRGILNPGAVDRIDVAGDGAVEVHIEQTVPWDGSDQLLLLLQEKLFNHLAFVADGDLVAAEPRARRRWRVVLDCTEPPDERTADLVRRAADQFRALGGELVTRLPPAAR